MNRKHYLQQDYEKLIQYAKSMGLKVVHKKRNGSDAAAMWSVDGESCWITIFHRREDNLTWKVLSLLHELSHHRAFINNGRSMSDAAYRAFEKFNEDTDKDSTIPKKYRKIIYENERDESIFQPIIHNELGLKIPIYKVLVEIEHNAWNYRHYYLKGQDPNKKQQLLKRQKLTKLYRKKLC